MERLLARLERWFGRFAIPHLMAYVAVGTAILWLLSSSRPEALQRLTLDLDAVRRGQVWRLVTFALVPPATSPFGVFMDLYFMWWVGSSLEQHWGAFKLNVYYFIGMLGAIGAAAVTGHASNFWLNSASLMLAFATLFPDEQIMLYFVLPIRVKWLGWLGAAFIAYMLATGGMGTKVSIAACLAGYVLFFAGHWWDAWKSRNVVVRQRARRAELEPVAAGRAARVARTCAICGKSEDDGADIRVCSCEKCGGKPRTLCLEHARNH
jgi:membrane associated rhomboid family serine protease